MISNLPVSTINSNVSNIAGGSNMAFPLLAMAGIQAGSSLLQGLLGGAGKKQDAKLQYQLWEKMRNQKMSDINKYLKPETPYYQTPYLPGIDRVMHQAILGNLGSRFGGTLGKWGINLGDIKKTMGLNMPFNQSSQAQKYYGAGQTVKPSPYLRERYGMEVRRGGRDETSRLDF